MTQQFESDSLSKSLRAFSVFTTDSLNRSVCLQLNHSVGELFKDISVFADSLDESFLVMSHSKYTSLQYTQFL